MFFFLLVWLSVVILCEQLTFPSPTVVGGVTNALFRLRDSSPASCFDQTVCVCMSIQCVNDENL